MPFRTFAPLLLIVLAACSAGDGSSAQSAAETPVSRALQGRVIGKPVSCLNNREILNTDVITEQVVLFRMRGGRIYRNDLPEACPRLGRPGTAFSHRSTMDKLCDIDVIQLFDPTTGMGFGSCRLGKFLPYELPKDNRAE